MHDAGEADAALAHPPESIRLDALSDGLAVLGEASIVARRDATIVLDNPAARTLFGHDALEGCSLHDLAADSAEVDRLLGRWWTTSSPRPGVLRLQDGTTVRCDGARLRSLPYLLVRMRTQQHAVRPFAQIRTEVDADNLRQLSQRLHDTVAELRTTNLRLRAANDELNQYAAAVSHDLRTPLYTMRGYVELLLEDGLIAPDGLPLAQAIQRGVERLERMTTALLSVARLEAGDPPDTPVDLQRVLDNVRESLRDELRAAGAEVVVGPLPAVWVGEAPLTQVMQNLLANSLRYRAADRPLRIEISARDRDGTVEVAVTDNGIGVPEGEHERIFELFHRAATGQDGTGIGLTTCRKLVTQWGGQMRSVPTDIGARLEFTVPSADLYGSEPAPTGTPVPAQGDSHVLG